jgi:hypothetical protein
MSAAEEWCEAGITPVNASYHSPEFAQIRRGG